MSSEIVRRPLVSRNKKAHLAFLEITDFKSYAGSHNLGPLKKGMNCIVGPNGSGKSNLMEAICWVLGVETRHLRGVKMADLAYRKEGEPRNITRRPEVKLTIHVEDADGNTLEVKTFKRRVADNRFTFLIDEKIVDKDAYYKTLATYGILPKVQNCIVSQGQVESLSMKSEKEKGILFDEVSGSALLKPRYEQLKTRLREFDLELRKVQEKIKRKDTERKSYEAQTKELESFEKAEEEAKKLEQQLYLFKLYVNSTQSEEITTRSEAIDENLIKLSKHIEAERHRYKEVLAKKRHLETQARNYKELKHARVAALSRMERDIESQEKKIKFLEQSLDACKLLRNNKQAEIDSLYEKYKDIVTKWLATIESYESKEQELSREQTANAYANLSASQRADFEEKVRAYQGQTSLLRARLAECTARVKELSSTLRTKRQSREASEESRQGQESLLKKEMEEVEMLKSEMKASDSSRKKLADTRKELEATLIRLESQESELTVKEQNIAALLASSTSARREDTRLTRFKEMVEKLQQRYPGVYGRLCQLCELTNQTYATAVSVAMGLQADSVVCDTFATAQMAVKYLKEARHPPVEFLPLDRLRVRDDASRLNQYSSLFTPIINCISFDPKHRKAFAQVLEDVVAVDNLEAARALAYQKSAELNLSLKIVTLDGQKILKNCNIQISGGGERRRNRFEDSQREEHMRVAAEIENELRRIGRERRNCEDKLVQLTKEIEHLEYLREQHESRMRSLSNAIENRRTILSQWMSLSEVDKELEQLSQALEKKQNEHKDLEAEITRIETQGLLSSPEMVKWHQAKKELQEIEARRAQLDLEYHNQVDDCESRINDIMRSLDLVAPNTTTFDVKMKMLEKELQAPSGVSAIEGDINSQQEKLKEERVMYNNLSVKYQEAKRLAQQVETHGLDDTEISSTEKTLKEIKDDIQKKELEMYDLGMEKSTLSERLAEMDTQAMDIMNEVVSKSVKIPTKNGTFEDLTRTWRAKATNEMDDGNGVDIDFTQIPIEWADHLSPKASRDKELEIATSINEKRSQLRVIHPNFKAREQLEEAKESSAQLKKQYKELSAERQKIDDEFSKCRECRSEKFRRCFEKTRTALESIYSELTRGTEDYSATEIDPSVAEIWKKHFSNVPGGVARLELIEEPKAEIFESGISFYAMPPGKRFTEMDALSGGEKSMATLALLFALQSHRPSPFVVLDEVDAALDVTNVQSLRNWLKKAPFQVVIVSLKDEMYCHADAIIGVYKDHENESSGTLSLDVEAYA